MADMATQPITGLPSKTASQMANTDKLLGIDNAEGYQMLIQDLGDYIIQHATSSLAGSNQTLAAVINLLNSKVSPYTYTNDTGSFLDWVTSTFTANGDYYVIYAASNSAGWPVNLVGTCMVQKRNSDIYLYAFINETNLSDNQAIYLNRYTNNAWKSWSKLPTRAEMDSTCRLMAINTIAENTDLDTVTTIGEYTCLLTRQAATLQHKPSALNTAFRMRVELMTMGNNDYVRQTIYEYASNNVYTRYTVDRSAWLGWTLIPTRAEMDNAWTLSNSPNSNITSRQDLDSFLTPGVFDCASSSIASSLLHRPEAVTSGFRLIVSQSGYGSSSYAIQIILIASGSAAQQREFRRAYLGTPPNGTWSDWVQTPTRAEMNAVTSAVTPVAIVKDTDLNTLTTEGAYYASTGAVAQSLINCPVSANNFTMLVMKKGAYYNQVIFTGTTIFVRGGGSSGFGDWYKCEGTAVS